jgi:hypothetical protein
VSETVTIRLDSDAIALLRARAATNALPPATLAAKLIIAGLGDGPAPEPRGDGEIVARVLDAFADVDDPNVRVHREVAIHLARQVESAGPSALSAGTRLVRLLEDARVSDEARQAMAALSTPAYSTCASCRKEM